MNEYTDDQIAAIKTGNCPDCGEECDEGTFIPTMTTDISCISCDFSLELPEYDARIIRQG